MKELPDHLQGFNRTGSIITKNETESVQRKSLSQDSGTTSSTSNLSLGANEKAEKNTLTKKELKSPIDTRNLNREKIDLALTRRTFGFSHLQESAWLSGDSLEIDSHICWKKVC